MLAAGAVAAEEDGLSVSSFSFSSQLSLSGFSPAIMDDDTQGAKDEELSLISLPLSVVLNLNNCDWDGVEGDNLSVGSVAVGTDVPAIIHALQEANYSQDTAGAEDGHAADGATSQAREEDDLLHIGASWMRKYQELKVSASARGHKLFYQEISVFDCLLTQAAVPWF